ncbi:porin [Roseateles violae]|uniref:Porin n=1 Tax=Roseateles violae TaxID=3058042 RepID=A0ABT8DTF0_9BURK|nr:porin [Pelomonas sp. PFR6]MDN3920295.1 porin [Pelomonas sp. PFR6]
MRFKIGLIAAVLASSFGAANAQQSSITVYGIVDAGARYGQGLDSRNRPIADSTSGLASGVSRTSRLGFRGSEDLGDGLSAIFNFEHGLNLDTGVQADAVKFWDRASYVGTKASWGTLTLGRQTNLMADTLGAIDPLNIRYAGYNPNVQFASLSAHGHGLEFGSTGSTTGSYRLDNSVKYALDLGAWSLKAMYGFGEGSGDNNSSKGLGAGYRSGAFSAQAAYMNLQANQRRELDAYIAGAAYSFSWGQIRGSYAGSKADLTATTTAEYRTASLGVTAPLPGGLELTLSAYDVERKRSAQKDDGFLRGIAFLDYPLSRRTMVYAEFDHTRWRDGYQGAGNRDKATGLTLGVSHNF